MAYIHYEKTVMSDTLSLHRQHCVYLFGGLRGCLVDAWHASISKVQFGYFGSLHRGHLISRVRLTR